MSLVPAPHPLVVRSPALVRWTVLTAFASGLAWLVPAAAALLSVPDALLLLPAVTAVGAVASVLQAHLIVGRRRGAAAWPAEWTAAAAGIGPNALIAALALAAFWPAGWGSRRRSPCWGAAPRACWQAPGWIVLPALAGDERRGWRYLAVVSTGWLGLQLGLAATLALALLV
ncbi:MAG: hypothetical protein R3F59_11920 [Myxococcota bacterium]